MDGTNTRANPDCPPYPNRPLTHQTGGPLDKPLKAIAARLGATEDQVLFAWAKAKGAVVVT